MLRLKMMLVLAVTLFANACGGSSYSPYMIDACETAADCDCPAPADEITCNANGVCECYYSEEVEVPVEVPVEVGCQSASDCNCGSSSTGPYQATCLDQMCYCAELSSECYPLTRGEYVDQLVRKLINLDEYFPPVTPTYSDVPVTHENYAAIEAATEMGLITGYGDGKFGPENHLNRAEGTKLVVVAVDGFTGYEPPAQSSYFDVLVNAWYYEYVEAATAYGWTRGYVNSDGSPTGYFGPADTASSCFMDALMARAEFPAPPPDQIAIAIADINFNKRIAVGGQTEMLSVRYRVHYSSAAYPLNSLVVINQPGGENASIVSNQAISKVWINCAPPSGNGNWTMTGAELVNGIAQFSNLNCWDETGNGLEVEVAYDVSTFAEIGETLSGQLFRLVLDDLRLVDSQSEVPANVVRKTRLDFVNTPASSKLHNGQVTLFPFQASAHPSGSGGLARLVFMVDKSDADGNGSLAMRDFRFYRGASLLNVNIFDQSGQDLADSALTTTKLVVTFPNEETISAGTSVNYSLRATAVGVSDGDTFTTRIDFGDEDLPVTGKTGETTPNTARITSSIHTVGLFPGLLYFLFGTSEDRNVIWTDRSADEHHYSIEDTASSYDFTNGASLGIAKLSPFTLLAD